MDQNISQEVFDHSVQAVLNSRSAKLDLVVGGYLCDFTLCVMFVMIYHNVKSFFTFILVRITKSLHVWKSDTLSCTQESLCVCCPPLLFVFVSRQSVIKTD